MFPAHPLRQRSSGLGSRGFGHDAADLRKDRADAGGNVRHDRTRSDGHETSHQGVLDEVLTTRILPNLQLQNQIFHFSSNLLSLWCATGLCR